MSRDQRTPFSTTKAKTDQPDDSQAEKVRSLAARPVSFLIGNKDLDRKRMVDHVAAVVLVMLIGLDATAGVCGPGEQGVFAPRLWCEPIAFPASPRMPLNGI
jgi:hypothetical protein